MEEPNWKLINAAIEDIRNWIKEAPNQEVKDYRLGLLLEAMEPKQIMHYYRDGLESQINKTPDKQLHPYKNICDSEEFDSKNYTLKPPSMPESSHRWQVYEPYDSAFWHGELDRISKIVESKDAK